MFKEIRDFVGFYYGVGKSLIEDRTAANFSIDGIINIVVGLIIVAVLLPVGIEMFMDADIDPTSKVAPVWAVVPILVIIGVVVALIKKAI